MKLDYTRGNIVNLMGSMVNGLGGKNAYPPLAEMPPKEISKADTVILMIIDGLGYDSVQALPKKSFLRRHLLRPLTTVFPATTTAAITTFMTGVSPQEHGCIEWYMKLEEFGGKVVILLPGVTKEGESLGKPGKNLLIPPSLFDKIHFPSALVLKRRYYRSYYNHLLAGKASCYGYRALKLAEFTNATYRAVTASPQPKYVYTYWPGFDDLSHWYGKESGKAKRHLHELDQAIERLAQRLQGTNTLLLITADHGQVSCSKRTTIILEQHPLFLEYLSASLCGEGRMAIFYVKPEKRKQFEHYVKKHWGKYCTMHRSEELLSRGLFGLHKPHPQLQNRIGDYVLLPKGNYAFKEFAISKKHPLKVGHHGGLSKEELEVPLVKVWC